MHTFHQLSLATVLLQHVLGCLGVTIPPGPTVTLSARRNATAVDKRANIVTQLSTCGYLNGNPSIPWTADEGYNCRVDAANGVWGFCTTTVNYARDCGFNGACVDNFQCKAACGDISNENVGTATCKDKQQCTTALLNFGVDQTYAYIGCGPDNKILSYYATPTADAKPTTSSQESKEPSASESNPSASDQTTSAAELTTSTSVTLGLPSNSQSAGDTSENKSSGGKPNMTGPIIGGVIGGLALLCISVLAAIYLWRRNRTEPPPAYTPSVDSREERSRNRKTLPWSPPQELPASTVRAPSRYEMQG